MSAGAERLARLQGALGSAGLDALLVSALPNIRYLSGFSGSNALLLVPATGEATLWTDFRYATQVKTEVGPGVRALVEPHSLWGAVLTALREGPGGPRLIGFETDHLSHREAHRFLDEAREDGMLHWRATTHLVEALRESKDDGELSRIRTAVAIAETALERTLPTIRAGQTELEIAGRLEFELRRAGSEGFPFECIVAGGERSALPHARPSARPVRTGEFLLIDFGAVHAGYCSDLTRTVMIGAATARHREIHDLVREALGSASAGVRAGMRGRDADAIARDYIARGGYGEAFGHSLGHGIGLEVHEAPRLSSTADAPLPPGAVVTIEPGIYLEGWGGVRIEDDVVLGAEGPEVLSRFPRELVSL